MIIEKVLRGFRPKKKKKSAKGKKKNKKKKDLRVKANPEVLVSKYNA